MAAKKKARKRAKKRVQFPNDGMQRPMFEHDGVVNRGFNHPAPAMSTLVSYAGNDEVLVCIMADEDEFLEEWFTTGRDLNDYDRREHAPSRASAYVRVGFSPSITGQF